MKSYVVSVSEMIERNDAVYYALLSILDIIFSSIIVAPCVVGYWRSIWSLMDMYMFPDNKLLSAIVSAVIGAVGHMFFTCFQNMFELHFHPNRNSILYYIVSRFYTLCFSFCCVNGWRGPWLLLLLYFKTDVMVISAGTLIGVVGLIALKALRNLSSTPFVIMNDTARGYFEVLTTFKVLMCQNPVLYTLDCLFSVIVMGILVVFVWRGVWILIDTFLFSRNEIWSAWTSLIFGYVIAAAAFSTEPALRWICERTSKFMRRFLSDLFILIVHFGTVNVWRGIWNLLDIYFIPNDPELSCWIIHTVSLMLLIILRCSNSLLVRGVYIDVEELGHTILPCYFKIHFIHGQGNKPSISFSKEENLEVTKISIYENNSNVNTASTLD